MLDIKTVDGKKIDYPKQAQGFHGYYTVNATKWSVDSEGDIRDGEMLIAEPSYLSKYGRKNAALIAAAPELLSLLVEVVSELSDTDDEGLIEHTDWMIKARAVIAKATGQEAQDQLPF